jgi:hypothetical protein
MNVNYSKEHTFKSLEFIICNDIYENIPNYNAYFEYWKNMLINLYWYCYSSYFRISILKLRFVFWINK